jgi:hypothetical protein
VLERLASCKARPAAKPDGYGPSWTNLILLRIRCSCQADRARCVPNRAAICCASRSVTVGQYAHSPGAMLLVLLPTLIPKLIVQPRSVQPTCNIVR